MFAAGTASAGAQSPPTGPPREALEVIEVRPNFHVIAGAGHTFEVGHPFTAPSPALDEAIQASVGHFSRHLIGE